MDNFGGTGRNLNVTHEHRISSFMFHHRFDDANQLTVDFTKLETELLEEHLKNRMEKCIKTVTGQIEIRKFHRKKVIVRRFSI